jgi:peptidoglycan/LPS O-acetylase OafA/YrhL
MKRDIPQLHAIRALAMAAIFFHHLWQGSGALRRGYAGTLLDTAFLDMALGVVVFNAMTAFLMGLPYCGDQPLAAPAPGPAIRKRLWRLYPQYALAVVGFTGLSVAVFRLTDFGGVCWGMVSHLLFLDTFQVSPFYGNMAAFWWLGLLVQFTVVFPWLARWMLRPGWGPAGCFFVSAAILWPLTGWIQARGAALPGTSFETFAFLWTFNLPARLPEFCCGLWLAKAWHDHGGPGWPFGRGVAVFLGGACLFTWVWGQVPGVPPLGHMTGAIWSVAVFAALFALPGLAALGRLRAVRRVSTLSYGIYLAHQPLLSFGGPATAGLDPWTRFGVLTLGAGTASLVAAWLLARGAAWLTERLRPHSRAGKPAIS